MLSPEAEALLSRADDFRRDLHVWYDANHRLLPWRTKPSVYGTVVSEFMCQQTQVDTVLPYFDRWLVSWPDFRSLAGAGEETVMKAWEGLGYYRRARNLHALAKEVAAMPEPPRTAAGWLPLPGIGSYTAAAIASIAFGDPVAVVDGNVVRVLSRLTGETRTFKDNGSAVKHFDPLAQAMVDPIFPGDFNQAMMELGATVCYRVKPLCALCPVRDHCAAEKRGVAESIPKFLPKAVEKVFVDRLFVTDPDTRAVLLRRYGPDSRTLAGICELPEATGLVDLPGAENLIAVKRRAITTRRFEESIYRAAPTPDLLKKVKKDPELIWVGPEQMKSVTLSGPHKKWLSELMRER